MTYKAYSQYPFLIENSTPKRLVHETVLGGPHGGEARLKLTDPLVIYSRLDLNRMLLERAERAGAQIEKARVLEMSRQGGAGSFAPAQADRRRRFLHRRDGRPQPAARGGHRTDSRETPWRRWAITSPGDQARIDIQFLPRLEGYIWVFPRCGHLSVGICGKGEPASLAAPTPGAYMTERGIAWKGAAFYSHLLPSLDAARGRRTAWRAKAGWRWAMPPAWWTRSRAKACITPFARPTWRRARCFPTWASWLRRLAITARLLRRDFAADLEFGARLAKRLFLGRFLFGSVPQRMVQFTRRSPRFSAIMQDLFAGQQPYLGLKRRLLRNLNGSLYDVGMSLGFSRLVPRKAG